MVSPAYVVKKVGESYQIVPKEAMNKPDGVILVAGGGLLAMYGTMRGGLRGLLMLAAGFGALWYGAGQVCTGCKRVGAHKDRQRSGRGPSYQRESPRVAQRPYDEVDEASMESFPTSDPPASMARNLQIGKESE